jgi:hypothetical protein
MARGREEIVMALPPPDALILMGDWCEPAEGATPRPAKTRAHTGWHDPCEDNGVNAQKKATKRCEWGSFIS